ncbi:virulence factor BrkB family protein [Vibrio sp. SS-MA-C1-2]|uniref:virulence factor BrkB family protein n=1 Tax=Vibrio sp. SS-MA-C1-2 TaxID=2908646 RepID=UPI001F388443|nr:virulence factor BrkB family protein [Vibrio sp. SS-MA-C1-2]UJF19435.1 virulence factor BrkB family protein [Vibrio sp. SS-MA-C1-2]
MDNRIQHGKFQVTQFVKSLYSFFRHLIERIQHDRLTVTAGYLAYVTLLSVVPLVTVILSTLSRFPEFAGIGLELQKTVISHVVPAAGDVLLQYLNEFVANAGKMTLVGVGFLFVVALMLISNIDNSLNYIWRVQEKRRRVISFSIYWMILTLGPLLVGASLVASSYILSLNIIHNEVVDTLAHRLLSLLPILSSFLAFLGLFQLVPNKRVKIWHSAFGALITSLMFELAKKGFALYLANFPSYQLIYGALAVVPILFVWVYLCWCIVLIGAEITASLGERREEKRIQILIGDETKLLQLTERDKDK